MTAPASPSRRPWIVAALCVAAAVAWLAATRSEPPESGRNFFGHWRTMPIAVALALVWVALLALCSRRRAALFGFVFANILAGAVVVLLEVTALAGVVDYAVLMRNRVEDGFGSEAVPNVDLRGETYPDTARSWNLPAAPVPFRYRTDGRGFRNPEHRDAADVYMLGDSILVAGMLPFEQTVTARLERELGRPAMNLALIGIGPQRERDLLRDSDLPLEGRLVLQLITEGNDLGDSAYYRSRAAGEPDRRGLAERSFTKNAVLWVQRLLQPTPYEADVQCGWIGDQRYLFWWVDTFLVGLEGEVAPVLEAIALTHELVAQSGGTHALVLVPSKYRVLYELCRWPEGSRLARPDAHLSPLRDALREWSARSGVALLDLTQPMQAAARAGRVPYYPDDTHPNASGHELMTREILQWDIVQKWRNGAR